MAEYVGGGIDVPCPPRASQIRGIGHTVLKIRVGSSDMKKGKSGGFRAILALCSNEEWAPVLIYAKASQADISPQEIVEAILEEMAGPFG